MIAEVRIADEMGQEAFDKSWLALVTYQTAMRTIERVKEKPRVD